MKTHDPKPGKKRKTRAPRNSKKIEPTESAFNPEFKVDSKPESHEAGSSQTRDDTISESSESQVRGTADKTEDHENRRENREQRKLLTDQ